MQANSTSPQTKAKRRERDPERGSSFVETALIATFLLIPLIVGAIDFGRAYFIAIEVANAARTAVQYGSQNTQTMLQIGNQSGTIDSVAESEAPDVSLSCGAGVNACWVGTYPQASNGCECSSQTLFSGGTSGTSSNLPTCTCPGGHSIYYSKVITRVTYTPLFNLFGPITLNSQAKMRYALQ